MHKQMPRIEKTFEMNINNLIICNNKISQDFSVATFRIFGYIRYLWYFVAS